MWLYKHMYWLDIKILREDTGFYIFANYFEMFAILRICTTENYYLSPPSHPSSQILRKYLF